MKPGDYQDFYIQFDSYYFFLIDWNNLLLVSGIKLHDSQNLPITDLVESDNCWSIPQYEYNSLKEYYCLASNTLPPNLLSNWLVALLDLNYIAVLSNSIGEAFRFLNNYYFFQRPINQY